MSDENKQVFKKVPSTIIGAAAEHFVMSKLLLQGKIAALAPKGVPELDIIVSDRDGNHLFAVQVKARRIGSDGGWRMDAKHENIKRALLFYCFVDFAHSANGCPKCWIVPSSIVAKVLTETHRAYFAKGKKDSKMRSFLPHYKWMEPEKKYMRGWLNKYEEAWEPLAPLSAISD